MVIQAALRNPVPEEGRRIRRWASHRAQGEIPQSMHLSRSALSFKSKSPTRLPTKTSCAGSLVPSHLVRSPQGQILPNLLAISSDVYLHIYKHMLLLPFLEFSTLDIIYCLPTIRRLGFSSLLPLLKAEQALVNQKPSDLSKRKVAATQQVITLQLHIGRLCQSTFICN